MSKLQNNITSLQNLLEQVNALPDASGVELPELNNEGSASDLMLGKELIDADGSKIIGTFSIDTELNTQDDLIAQIQAVVDGLPEASGGGNAIESVVCSVLEDGPGEIFSGEIHYLNDSGAYTKSSNISLSDNITVMKNSIIVIAGTTNTSGGLTRLVGVGNFVAYYVDDDFYITANM